MFHLLIGTVLAFFECILEAAVDTVIYEVLPVYLDRLVKLLAEFLRSGFWT